MTTPSAPVCFVAALVAVLLSMNACYRQEDSDKADKAEASVHLSSAGGQDSKDIIGTTIPTLRQAIEKRFGRPDRVVGERNSLLCYHLENGETLIIVVGNEKILGIEHTKDIDLKKAVGVKVTIVGVYRLAKGDDEVVPALGERVSIAGEHNGLSRYDRLVSVTGVLHYFPGNLSPYHEGIPPYYYLERDSVVLKVLYPIKLD